MCFKFGMMVCVLILKFGLDWYDYWYMVIIYEGDFVLNCLYCSEDGVVYECSLGLSGEVWLRGLVILFW